MVIIGYFLSPSSLILESAEKGVSMHVDAGLLPEKSLPIPSKPVKEGASDLSHLLHFELVLLFLEVFNSVKRYFSNRHIFSRTHMKINLKLIDFGLGLHFFAYLRTQLPLLSEKVLEEDCQG
jgi:hypothetical protein